MADSRIGVVYIQIHLEHLIVPESKEVLRKQSNGAYMAKEHSSQVKELSVDKPVTIRAIK